MYALRLTSFRSMIACYVLEDRERELTLNELEDSWPTSRFRRWVSPIIVAQDRVETHYRERLANRMHRIEE